MFFGGTDPAVSKGVFLGYRNASPGQGFKGSMGEVLVFDTNLTDDDLNSVGNYLGAKWGITWTDIWTRPVMTSNSTPSPYTISTNSVNPVGTEYKGFDGFLKSNNWWHTASGIFDGSGNYLLSNGKPGIANHGAWLVMDMLTPRSISKYTYHTRVDATNGIAKSWHIIYSNDGENYTSAHNQDNVTLGVNTSNVYTFTPTVAKYWGIQVYKVNGTNGISITQELTFATN